MTFAVQADIEATMGRALTATEATYASRLIAMASEMVRKEARQNFDLVTDDTITLAGNWDKTLQLPQRPVVGITSLTVNGQLYNSSQYKWNRAGKITLNSGSFMPDFGNITTPGNQMVGPAGSSGSVPASSMFSWGGPGAVIVVVYDHGFATIPQDITNIVAGMVALQMSTSPGIVRETIGTYSAIYAKNGNGGGMSLTEENKKELKFYRLGTFAAPMKPTV